jgi:hypothetical protein
VLLSKTNELDTRPADFPMRRLITSAVVLFVLVSSGVAAAYPWPIKPFDQPHPIRANFGDPRTVFFDQPPTSLVGPGQFSFHNGVDIAAPTGTRVYPVADGIAHYLSPTWLAVRTLGVEYRYIHIHPVVFEGQTVYRSRTVLGTVEPWAGHLHFTELRGGRAINPLRPGHLTPYFDHTKPRVTELSVRALGGRNFAQPLTICGKIAMTAIAQDSTSLPVPGAWAGLPVAPASVSWTMTTQDGRTIVRPHVVVDFLQPLLPNTMFWDVYARGTFQNSARFGRIQLSRLEGRFVFVLSPDWDTRRLADGDYVLTVTATDARGNSGTLSEAITVANGSPDCPA